MSKAKEPRYRYLGLQSVGHYFESIDDGYARGKEWCEEQFGLREHQPSDDRRWRCLSMGMQIWIRDAADATAFRVRWC